MIIAVINQKGGTGKTTTSINLGAALQTEGNRVLLIDVDPQGSLSYSLGINEVSSTVSSILLANQFNDSQLTEVGDLTVLPINDEVVHEEIQLVKGEIPYIRLQELLQTQKDAFDYILLDCPPGVSFLSYSALLASDAVLIPMLMDVLSLKGIEQLLAMIKGVEEEYNKKIEVLGVLSTMVDKRRNLTKEVKEYISKQINISCLETEIRNDVKIAEAPSFGKSVLEFAPRSRGANDYKKLAKELLKNFNLKN